LYNNADYLSALPAAGIERCISRAGHCYDNAALEVFKSTLKAATGRNEAIPVSRDHTKLAVFDYIGTV
jgi:transposase InsO family protein